MRIFRLVIIGVGAAVLSAASCRKTHKPCVDAQTDCAEGLLCHEGACIQCVTNSDCGTDSICATYTCDTESHTCTEPQFVGPNIEVENPTPGDCVSTRCDGAGNILTGQPANDPPADEGNPCTVEACPTNTYAAPGTACSFGGGFTCDASGNCVVSYCDEDSDCGADTYCFDVSCDLGTNSCTGSSINEGLIVPVDASDDCVENTCVAGVITPRNDDTETPPQDGNVCTAETCSAGGIVSVPSNLGGICNGGAGVCDNAGACGPRTLLSENFDGLPTSGTSTYAIFKTALASGTWQLASDAADTRAGPGTGSTGAIWSFGSSGSSERALGGYATVTTGTQGWGVCITNPASVTLSTISVSYTGEQWRNGNTTPQSLTFSFTTFYDASTLDAQLRTADNGDHTNGWESVSALSFTSPQPTSPAGALDGNAAANRTAISGNIPGLSLGEGATFCLRWIDLDDTGADHGLAIDDLVIRGH